MAALPIVVIDVLCAVLMPIPAFCVPAGGDGFVGSERRVVNVKAKRVYSKPKTRAKK